MFETIEGAFAISAVTLVAGLYFAFKNVSYLRDPVELEYYLRTSPKAKRWVDKHGMAKTKELSKKYFIPIGLLMSFALTVVGIRGVAIIAMAYL
jgi:hypothetical protein